jgi:EVE domain/HNH endonuclease
MQEDTYLAWQRTGFTGNKTHGNQLSRVRRLERAFGDLDSAYDQDRMADVLRRLAPGMPLPKGIQTKGEVSRTMTTLRHAANKYREFRQSLVKASPMKLPRDLSPIHPPKPANARRILQPTGYWMFSASPGTWDADSWAEAGEAQVTYTISAEDRELIQPGDLGVIKRTVWRSRPAEIVALVEILTQPTLRIDTDTRFFEDRSLARSRNWRVDLAVLLVPEPAIAIREQLPDKAAFKYLRTGKRRTTTAISRKAFEYVARLAGLSPDDLLASRAARDPATISQAHRVARDLTPKAKERMSKRIERGRVGSLVKAARKHRCQICEALGSEAVAFLKPNGNPYSEAHHVMPVAKLVKGSLAANNIMVLCPNHHRQAHYGRFEISSEDDVGWTVKIDRKTLRIERTKV